MFTYCNNTPSNAADSEGTRMVSVHAEGSAPAGFASPTSTAQSTRSGGNSGKVTRNVKAFFTNTKEEPVLRSKNVSFYKGVPVVRTNGSRSGYFGAIFLTRETNSRSNPEDMLRHEYGHAVQMKKLGVVKYLTNILIPSWREWGSNQDYYSREVEITADVLGGVESRSHTSEDIAAGFDYLDKSGKYGIIAWAKIK